MYAKRNLWIGAAVLLLAAGCNREGGVMEPPPDEATGLSPDLQSGCYSWPEQDFTPAHVAFLGAGLSPGGRAVEFTFRDIEGAPYTLSTLLETRPVLLILGSFT